LLIQLNILKLVNQPHHLLQHLVPHVLVLQRRVLQVLLQNLLKIIQFIQLIKKHILFIFYFFIYLNKKLIFYFYKIFEFRQVMNNTTTMNASYNTNFTTPETYYNEMISPNEMSIFVPHIDTKFSYNDIVHQFQDVFELGLIDRIEAVPKTNQTDGHPYLACFIYFWKWGNGYNAQHVYSNIHKNIPTRMYLSNDLYWMVLPNTSEVADLPLPKHMSFRIMCDLTTIPNTEEYIVDVFDLMNIGKVKADSIKIFQDFIELTMEYWYHSKTTYELQTLLEKRVNAYLNVNPTVDYKITPKVVYSKDELENDQNKWCSTEFWTIMYDDSLPATSGANPYIWFAREPNHPLNLEHPVDHPPSRSYLYKSTSDDEEKDLYYGMPPLEYVPPTYMPMTMPVYYVPCVYYPVMM
jgi:hypothetical protein